MSREGKLQAKRREEREIEIGDEREEEGKQKKPKTDGRILYTRSIDLGINTLGCVQDSSR